MVTTPVTLQFTVRTREEAERILARHRSDMAAETAAAKREGREPVFTFVNILVNKSGGSHWT